MADYVQIDGRRYIPLSDGAAIARVPDTKILAAAREGKVLLRAIGKKIYVDYDAITRMQGESPAAAPSARPAAPAPVQKAAPAFAEALQAVQKSPPRAYTPTPLPAASVPAPAAYAPPKQKPLPPAPTRPVAAANPVAPAAPSPALAPVAPHPHHLSSAEFSAMSAPLPEMPVPASRPAPQAASAPAPVPAPVAPQPVQPEPIAAMPPQQAAPIAPKLMPAMSVPPAPIAAPAMSAAPAVPAAPIAPAPQAPVPSPIQNLSPADMAAREGRPLSPIMVAPRMQKTQDGAGGMGSAVAALLTVVVLGTGTFAVVHTGSGQGFVAAVQDAFRTFSSEPTGASVPQEAPEQLWQAEGIRDSQPVVPEDPFGQASSTDAGSTR